MHTKTTHHWQDLKQAVTSDEKANGPRTVFGDLSKGGGIYRWGLGNAQSRPIDPTLHLLTKLAGGSRISAAESADLRWESSVADFCELATTSPGESLTASTAVIWAASLPGLIDHLDEPQWWDLVGGIQEYVERLSDLDSCLPATLIGKGEVGLTLATRLAAVPSCNRLRSTSISAIEAWFRSEEEAVSATLSDPAQLRLVLASLVRCEKMVAALPGESGRWPEADYPLGSELATWVAALTRRDGTQVFSSVSKSDLRDDLGARGLLRSLCAMDPDVIGPAIGSALGVAETRGRLSWQVSLPEGMLHDEEARLACLLPEWDVRRARASIRYADPAVELEVSAGKRPLISGSLTTQLSADGVDLTPQSDWELTCEYTDDDVHYLELEQVWSGGFILQRQFMLIREDRCCVLADAVLQGSRDPSSQHKQTPIEYQLHLPLAEGIRCEFQEETTDCFFEDDKRQAMLLPLAANEWRGPGQGCEISAPTEGRCVVRARGAEQLCIPLWLDFSRTRFSKPVTWRPLTVAENLELVGCSEAVAYRIQVEYQQWLMYRSLAERVPRTFFGRHMIADFYCARFDAEAEEFEELITVEENSSEVQA